MPIEPKALMQRYRKARERRLNWEDHWRQCYEFALPQREGTLSDAPPGSKRTDRLFDATAPDAVDQLAASLLAQLTPPWWRWFSLSPGGRVADEDRGPLDKALESIGEVIRSHFDRSNFAMEMHQCYLDLVTCGSACLLFEEAKPGEASAFRFTAVPLAEVVLEEGPSGKLDTTFRAAEMTVAAIRDRFPEAELPERLLDQAKEEPDHRFAVIEAVVPQQEHYQYQAFLEEDAESDEATVLAEGRFAASPFINFRWLKVPGEVYGRSPVMKALPDIKTANKVVELILKNAAIAVTGIWQADDDGVLNPTNIKLAPGTIIPKAVGSAGLTPLSSPGDFDMSQLVLEDLRKHIRHALLADRLGQVDSPKMTATEVVERSTEMARVLGATFGRLQSELLNPMLLRAMAILRRRGEIEPVRVDGRVVDLQYRSPLAQSQARQDAQNIMSWLGHLSSLGPEAMAAIDGVAIAHYLARTLGVPGDFLKSPDEPTAAGDPTAAMASQPGGAPGQTGLTPEELPSQLATMDEKALDQAIGSMDPDALAATIPGASPELVRQALKGMTGKTLKAQMAKFGPAEIRQAMQAMQGQAKVPGQTGEARDVQA